jgi:hypothetical protein
MNAAIILAAVNAPKGYLNMESGGIDFDGPLKWIVIVAILGGVAHLTYWLVRKTQKDRAEQRQISAQQASRAQSFHVRAEVLGLRKGEAKTVERIARRLVQNRR